ncbi:MAG: DUF438 domain-containing protein [Clostridiales bacterium]|nr:DUF438 domain-containing protein [Clostridiales bacterium]
MSEYINNREHRKQVIKDIIGELHNGKTVDEVKQKFDDAFSGVTATEIGAVEQALILEGLPVSEIQKLCDVHAAVFKGSIEDIHRPVDVTGIPGHPTNVLKLENRYLVKLMEEKIKPYIPGLPKEDAVLKLKEGFRELLKIDIHYSKKENLYFPYMEKYGTTAPPQVMWGVDDEIRAQIKEIIATLEKGIGDSEAFKEEINSLLSKVDEMIFKEENILLPMLLDMISEEEWKHIADDSDEIGFIIDNVPVWNPALKKADLPKEEVKSIIEGVVSLQTGEFKLEELDRVLSTLPLDITFVDKDDKVKYFSQTADRIFPRTKAVLGRDVSNCHPPASVHVVDDIVKDFKSGSKDHEEFWIPIGDRFIYIRYFAVRSTEGEYLGVLEVTQDIKPIQDITGEKRLVSE